MGILLKRISDLYDIWEAEDALRQPTLTIDSPAGTLNDAANTIIATLKSHGLHLMIDTFTGATPVSAYHFFNVTANEAFRSLAKAANINCFANGPNTIFSPLNLIVD